ncbi:hypothetical protein EV184_1299 [Sinorhizobium americanum]|uniref:Uncharacterized protein n=1 Tax=Sinorhizobium americanum TaxID=194963 RepID=A0A4V2RC67_9HYPH|nr:hypothetical protein EV184_1299 [Sinorhizobium americanum]
MGASVVSGCDASPVFDPAEHVFDPVALFVESGVVFDGLPAISFGRDARENSLFSIAKPVGIIAAIGQELFGLRQVLDENTCALEVADLPFGEQQQ